MSQNCFDLRHLLSKWLRSIFDLFRPSRSEKIKSEIWDVCNNSLACIISLINVYNHLHSEVSQIFFEGGVAKTLYIPYKLILIGGVANQNNFATPPKYLRPLLTMQLKSRVKTNLRHFPTIYLLSSPYSGPTQPSLAPTCP